VPVLALLLHLSA